MLKVNETALVILDLEKSYERLMASRDIRNVEKDYLTCALCLDNYKEPKRLPCGHTFCRVCLEAHIQESRVGNNQIKCPIDRKRVSVDAILPAEELAHSFPDNTFLKDLSNVVEEHANEPALTIHGKCITHENKPNDCVCITCGQIICGHCALLEHNPKGCHTTTLEQASVDFDKNFDDLKIRLETHERAVASLGRKAGEDTRSSSAANLLKTVTDFESAFKECSDHILETAQTIKQLADKDVRERRQLEENLKEAMSALDSATDTETPHESLTRFLSIQAQMKQFEEKIPQLFAEQEAHKPVESVVQNLGGLLEIMLDSNACIQAALANINS